MRYAGQTGVFSGEVRVLRAKETNEKGNSDGVEEALRTDRRRRQTKAMIVK